MSKTNLSPFSLNKSVPFSPLAAYGSPVTAAEANTEVQGLLSGEWQFHSRPIARPDETAAAALYDIEGMLFGLYGVTHPSLIGAFEGGLYSGDPRGDWEYRFETTRAWAEDQDRVDDALTLRVFPLNH